MTSLASFWAGMLALLILLYVLLDGFDLGVGILFGLTRNEAHRRAMMGAIGPFWDGNETWLVLAGATLFGAFPLAYAMLLSAFYLPVIIMLAGLILRGVAFEFRERTRRARWLWDAGFAGGSTVATFMQGAMVGMLVAGLPIEGDRYIGAASSWLRPFPLACGAGLVLGYALLGSAWLILKTSGSLREAAYRSMPPLIWGCAAALIGIFSCTALAEARVMERWIQQPALLVFPLLGSLAALALLRAVRDRRDNRLFPLAALGFGSAFATLGASFWPYLVPFSITLGDAAAPAYSLSFMFWGAGIVVFPLTLLYTGINYAMFRGKTRTDSGDRSGRPLSEP